MSDIWYMLQDQDRYVYHYTRASTLANHILASGKLRLSRFRDVNDPRESKDWVFHYHSITSDLGFEIRPIEVALNERLKHSQRLACFVSDTYEGLVTKQKEDRGEDILGAPYERGHSRPRMWAQYGENYAGACLVFDKAKLDAGIRSLCKSAGWNVYTGRVVYRNSDTLPTLGCPHPLVISVDQVDRLGLAAALDTHFSEHWQELFFVKSRDWEQEREFRWLVTASGDDDLYVDVRDSLVGIALGDRFPDCLKVSVGEFAKANATSLAVMNWQNGYPQPSPTHWRPLLQTYPKPVWRWGIASCKLAALMLGLACAILLGAVLIYGM